MGNQTNLLFREFGKSNLIAFPRTWKLKFAFRAVGFLQYFSLLNFWEDKIIWFTENQIILLFQILHEICLQEISTSKLNMSELPMLMQLPDTDFDNEIELFYFF